MASKSWSKKKVTKKSSSSSSSAVKKPTKDVKKTKKTALKIVSKKSKKPKVVVDLTKTEDNLDESLYPVCKPEPEEDKFVIDKKSGTVVDAPLYKPLIRPKPRSVRDLLDGLKCQANLIPPSQVDTSIPRKAVENNAEKEKKEAKMKLKRLRSGVKISKKDKPTSSSSIVDPWNKGDSKQQKKRVKLTVPLPEEPIVSLPLSYNPSADSESLRATIKEAANVLSVHDRKKAKIERVASAIRNAKPLSMKEQLDEMSVGLFDDEVEEGKEEDSDDGQKDLPLSKPKQETKRLTKQERKRRKQQERTRQLAEKRKEQNRLMHDFYRLRVIRNEVAAEAARRSALQTDEVQKEAAKKRKRAIWHKVLLKKATIQAARQREATALVQRAPAEIIGDSNAGMESGKSLRLIQARSKCLPFDRFVSAQRRGLLLDYRSMESGRRAITKHKRHGYKTFEVNR